MKDHLMWTKKHLNPDPELTKDIFVFLFSILTGEFRADILVPRLRRKNGGLHILFAVQCHG